MSSNFSMFGFSPPRQMAVAGPAARSRRRPMDDMGQGALPSFDNDFSLQPGMAAAGAPVGALPAAPPAAPAAASPQPTGAPQFPGFGADFSHGAAHPAIQWQQWQQQQQQRPAGGGPGGAAGIMRRALQHLGMNPPALGALSVPPQSGMNQNRGAMMPRPTWGARRNPVDGPAAWGAAQSGGFSGPRR
jgi:hypothetical protein